MGRAETPKPLAGFTIGVTADRRSDEQISLLAGRGAECMHGPTVRTHPLRPEAEIAESTAQLLADPPRFVLMTTGIGVRGWLEAADALLIGEELRAVLGASRLLVRGPKAHGAAITAGLDVEWNAPTATTAEVIDKLGELAEPGDRVGVQIDGDARRSIVPALRARGYDVIAVPVYRWSLPDDVGRAQSLVRAVVDRRVDLVTFTARPAAENFTQIAEDLDLLADVQAAFAEDVQVVCIGHVCAEGVVGLCNQPIIPERFRLGAMVMTITAALSATRQTRMIGGYEVTLQGRQVEVADAEPVMLTGRERQILQVLLRRDGAVVAKEHLMGAVWGGGESDVHVAEVTVGRLRRRLGPAGAGIETVIRRGYRLSPT
ncbi:MAG: uroporphyrinogen-III synthase [Actinomycetota bacterium]